MPVGYCFVRLIETSPHIEEVSVHPEHGRRGLGRRLIDAALDWARVAGHRRITLTTFRDLPWNGPFYERVGFVPLSDAEIGPELRERIRHEDEEGLPSALRLAMRLGL